MEDTDTFVLKVKTNSHSWNTPHILAKQEIRYTVTWQHSETVNGGRCPVLSHLLCYRVSYCWFGPIHVHCICLDGSHFQKLTLFRGLSRKKLPIQTVTLITKHLLSMSRGGPQRGHLPCAEHMKKLGCSVWSKDDFRESYSSSWYFTGKFLRRQSQVLHSGGRTKDNGQTETRTVLTGYRETPLFPQGQPSSRAGCPEQSGFHSWRFSRPSWIKAWATCSDTTTSHALSRRLGSRLPTDQGCNSMIQRSSLPSLSKWKQILPGLVVIINFAVRLKENKQRL